MEKEILNQAIDTAIDKSYHEITVYPRPRTWWAKLLAKYKIRSYKPKTYKLYNISPGNYLRVTSKILEIRKASIHAGSDGAVRDMFMLFAAHIERVAYMVAVSIDNGIGEPPKGLIKELMNGTEEPELRKAAQIMVKQLDVAGFTHTIVSIIGLDIVSQPAETSPSVPGVPSDTL